MVAEAGSSQRCANLRRRGTLTYAFPGTFPAAPACECTTMTVASVRRGQRLVLPSWLGWVGVALTTFFVTFVLPFFFPSHRPSYSRAYSAGANNRVAMIGIGSISVAVAVVCWWLKVNPLGRSARRQDGERDSSGPLIYRHLFWGVAALVGFTAALGSFVIRDGFYYSDAGYFLTQLRTGLVFHWRPYRDFEFPYGILLYEWPASFLRVLGLLGISRVTSYVVALAAAETVGVALLFYVLRALPMRNSLRVAAFALIVFGSMDPLLGINYSLLRFLLPLAAAVLLGTRSTLTGAALVAGAGELLMLFTSPELGLAFGGAGLGFGIYRALTGRRAWLAVSAATLAGIAMYVGLAAHDTLESLGKFAGGSFNLIIQPVPHILALLVAVVALAPLALVWSLRNAPAAAPILLPVYVVSLGLLPSALGRSDPLHVFFNGLGAYLLAFVAIDKAARRWRRIGVAAIALTFLYTQLQDYDFYKPLLTKTFHNVDVDDALTPATIQSLQQTLGPHRALFPWNMPLRLTNALTASGQFQPGYFITTPLDHESEEEKVREMRRAEFLMVPRGSKLVTSDDIDNGGFKRYLRLGYTYKVRQTPYLAGALMFDELQQHWTPAGVFGTYTLYRRAQPLR